MRTYESTFWNGLENNCSFYNEGLGDIFMKEYMLTYKSLYYVR